MGGPIGSLPTYVFGLLQIGTENSINRAWTGSLVLMAVGAGFVFDRQIFRRKG